MTITVNNMKPTGRRASNRMGVRTYSDIYVVTSDAVTNPYAVGSAAALPAIGDAHPNDASAFCESLDVVNTDGYVGWEVTANYTTDQGTIATSPLNDEVRVSWSSEVYQEPVFLDAVSGNAIVNSAGDYLVDPLITRESADLIARLKSNQASVPTWAITLQNTVNNAGITVGGLSIATGLAKYARLNIGEKSIRAGVTFYPCEFELYIRKDGWKSKPLDAGFRIRDASGKLVDIVNEGDTEKPSTPVPLDGAGGRLDDPSPTNNQFREFDVYPTGDLTTLPGVT